MGVDAAIKIYQTVLGTPPTFLFPVPGCIAKRRWDPRRAVSKSRADLPWALESILHFSLVRETLFPPWSGTPPVP